MSKKEIKNRWIGTLRHKASTYEHKARGKGETVTSPSLDDICNEIEAFFAGLCKDTNWAAVGIDGFGGDQ